MQSKSCLSITWIKPDLEEEQWEFFRHPDKQDYYLRHGIGWAELLSAWEEGSLEPYPRLDWFLGLRVSRSYSSYDDYLTYLAKAKRGYRRNYTKMEEQLQQAGALTLPAPTLICCGGEALLFSGYRRLCLAWNYGMIPYVWAATVRARPSAADDLKKSD